MRWEWTVAGRQEFERFPKQPEPFAVDQPGATQVAVEVAVFDEGREGHLGEGGWAPVDGLADRTDRRDERPGSDEKANAKGGGYGFAEGPDVDDPAVTVEALQRLQRSRGVTELAVVVVLDHCPRCCGRPIAVVRVADVAP
jgi:hypothetical protein